MKRKLISSRKPVDLGLPVDPPPGEDFFLAAIEIHSDDDPCWNDGFSAFGSWNAISPIVSQFLAHDPRARHSRVTIFQGDQARKALQFNLLQEARYQEQKRAQPSN